MATVTVCSDFGAQEEETCHYFHLICLLRNLYTGQEATVRTLYGKTDWFKSRKEDKGLSAVTVCLTYILSTS